MAKRTSASTKTKSTGSTKTRAPVSQQDDYINETIDSIRTPLKTGRAQTSNAKVSFKDFFANPTFKYVAGGIATAVLAKVASNLSHRYPEISRFLSENLDGIESRLAEFKSASDQDTVSRH